MDVWLTNHMEPFYANTTINILSFIVGVLLTELSTNRVRRGDERLWR